MGREAKTAKDRKCWVCKEVFNITAKELKRHYALCSEGASIQDRLAAIGMILPNNRNLIIVK